MMAKADLFRVLIYREISNKLSERRDLRDERGRHGGNAADDQRGGRGLPDLVAGREEDRVPPRRPWLQSGDLRDGLRRFQPYQPHQRPGVRFRARLVTRREPDRFHQRPTAKTGLRS